MRGPIGKASLVTIFVTVFLDLLGFGLVIPYLPGVARSLGASDFVAAALGASYSLGQLLFVPIWGALSDRVGRRPVLLVSVAATMLGMLTLGSAGSLWMLFAARIASGIATANIAVAQAYIADVTAPEERSKGMALIGVAIGLGFVLGPAIGGTLTMIDPSSRPGALPAFVAAALSFVNLLFVALALPESLPEQRRAKGGALRAGRRREAIRDALAMRPVLVAMLVNLVVTTSFAGLEQTFRLFTEDGFAMTAAETGYALLLLGIVLVLVQGGIIRQLAGRVPERTLVLVGLGLEFVGFALVSLSPPSKVLLCVGLTTLASGSSLVAPSLVAFVSRCAAVDSQGKVLGVLQSTGALSRVIGPLIAGTLYQLVSPRAPYAVAAGGMVIASLLASRLATPNRS